MRKAPSPQVVYGHVDSCRKEVGSPVLPTSFLLVGREVDAKIERMIVASCRHCPGTVPGDELKGSELWSVPHIIW